MLEVVDIHKSYSGLPALHGVHIAVSGSEILALLGPSGCGKTTLLRIVAGLETADSGQVLVHGEDVTHAPVHTRHFGFMFQDYGLFPHLNVFDNIGFGLRVQGVARGERQRRVAELLDLVGLQGYLKRSVLDLSGGEKQRVALARCLAPRPRLIMLDEPLAALDRAMRDHLGEEIKKILKAVGIPAILVTHDHGEAFALADKVAILDHGVVLQTGKPSEVFAWPVSTTVATFLGWGNVIRDGDLFALLCRELGPATAFAIRSDAGSLAAAVMPCSQGIGVRAEVREHDFRGVFYSVRVVALGAVMTFVSPVPWPVGRVELLLDRAGIVALRD